AKWRSETQKDIVVAALSNEATFVGILATGGGKSVAWLVPAVVEPAFKSIVIIPNRSLLEDMVRKTRALGISCRQWRSSDPIYCDCPVIYVALETAVGEKFKQFYREMEHVIKRIVFDEAHQLITSSEYR
ncbi:hypothetical protein GLOTRDRAFT_20594, partial [Gloeophyllum trabeum ATCC 11539]